MKKYSIIFLKQINKLNLNKLCCELNREDISKVAKKLEVNEKHIKKYINSVNISNSEKDLDNHFFNQSITEINKRTRSN